VTHPLHLHNDALRRLSDDTSSADRTVALRHLEDCADCRARWAAADESRLFALLATQEIPLEALDRLSASVRTGIEAPAASRRRHGLGFSVAASLLLALVLGGIATWGPPKEPAPEIAAVEAGEPAPTNATFELLSSPGHAQVVDLSVGETQIVMIFDEALDL